MRAAVLLSVLLMAGAVDAAPHREAERIMIDKSDRTLTILFEGGNAVTLRGVRFGPNWNRGPKRQRGDRKTPEGEYRVLEHRTSRAGYPDVTYLPALYLDYPNKRDVEASAELGVDPGDAIMIHGPHPDVPERVLAWRGDWTDGCAALSAAQIEYVMRFTREGTPVTIQP
nr:L,D-transpeptidase family protein [uncultured Sphingosinicella sp.]